MLVCSELRDVYNLHRLPGLTGENVKENGTWLDLTARSLLLSPYWLPKLQPKQHYSHSHSHSHNHHIHNYHIHPHLNPQHLQHQNLTNNHAHIEKR
jgi:hypothetical protein